MAGTLIDTPNIPDFTNAQHNHSSAATGGAIAGGGTVTTVSVVTANGFSGTVANASTTPAITIIAGAITPTTVVASDATTPHFDTAAGKTNTGYFLVNGKTSGSLKVTAADATAQAIMLTTAAQTVGDAILTIPNMAGVNKTVAWLESPVFTTPNIGTATGSVSGNAGTVTGLSVTGGKTLTVSDSATIATNAITLAGGEVITFTATNALTFNTTGATSVTLPTSGTLVNTGVTSLSSLATVGTLTSGTAGTGFVIAGVTITVGSDATGDMHYRNSSGVFTRIAPGAQNTFLKMGASSVPAWTTETIAAPGTSGNALISDGTNWTSAAPTTTTLNASPTTQTATGTIIALTYGESITLGDLLYYKSDSKVYKADATSLATAKYPLFGLALATAASGTNNVLLRGTYKDSTKWTGGTVLTVGGICYLSATAGATTQTQPSTADNIIQIAGIALATDVIYFCPSPDFITHT